MEEKNPIQVADRLFHTLELLSSRGEMGLIEISSELSLHKSTVHRLLNSLIFLGYARQREDGKYQATYKILDLANQLASNIDAVNVVRPYLRELARKTQETVHFVELDGVEAFYVDKVESYANSIQMVSRIGSRIPLYCTAVGKAMLACMSGGEVADIWENSHIVARTSKTITNFEHFLEELDAVKNQGYALDNEENEAGVRCIAVSLRDYLGKVRYALSISVPSARMDQERARELARCAIEIQKRIQREVRL